MNQRAAGRHCPSHPPSKPLFVPSGFTLAYSFVGWLFRVPGIFCLTSPSPFFCPFGRCGRDLFPIPSNPTHRWIQSDCPERDGNMNIAMARCELNTPLAVQLRPIAASWAGSAWGKSSFSSGSSAAMSSCPASCTRVISWSYFFSSNQPCTGMACLPTPWALARRCSCTRNKMTSTRYPVTSLH